MRSSIRPLLPEPGTAEQLLVELKDLVANPMLRPELRAEFKQLGALMEQLPRYEELWDKAAEEFGIHRFCQTLPSEQIAKYRAFPGHGEEDVLLEVVKKHLLEPNLEVLKKLPGWDERDFLGHWCGVFRTALMKEYLRRRDQNETDDGRLIRELLVQESDRAEILEKAAKSLTNGLFLPGEQRGSSEEAPAEAITHIWERASEFSKIAPVASNPVTIQAFMAGDLNRILGQARDHVRTLIETENRRLGHYEHDFRPEPDADPTAARQLVEIIPDRRSTQEKKLLIEQLLAKTPLEECDKELATLSFSEGWKQKDLGAKFGISQGQVSKRLGVVRDALRVVLKDQHYTKDPR